MTRSTKDPTHISTFVTGRYRTYAIAWIVAIVLNLGLAVAVIAGKLSDWAFEGLSLAIMPWAILFGLAIVFKAIPELRQNKPGPDRRRALDRIDFGATLAALPATFLIILIIRS